MDTFATCILRAAKAGHDLTVRQLALLHVAAVTPSDQDRQLFELAKTLHVARPILHRASAKMVDLGFMERSHLPGDRRTCVLTVTREGHRFIMDILGEPVPPAQSKSKKRRTEARPAA